MPERLVVAISLVSDQLTVGLDSTDLDRAELYLDDRRVQSLALHGKPMTLTLPDVRPGQVFRVEAFTGGEPAATRWFTT